jgi:hypothetical protein
MIDYKSKNLIRTIKLKNFCFVLLPMLIPQ